jgi:hypothetical protein
VKLDNIRIKHMKKIINISVISFFLTVSLNAEISKVGPELNFTQDSMDHNFNKALKSALPESADILSDLYWAKMCSESGAGFRKFAIQEASGVDYGQLLKYYKNGIKDSYLKKIQDIYKKHCKQKQII